MPTIGYQVVGATSAQASSNFNVQGFPTSSGMTYTATAGDTVTQVGVYASGTGNVAIAVYTVSGGLPATRVGSAVTVAVSGSAGWYTAAASIALTGGVEYTICWDYLVGTPDPGAFTYRNVSGTGGNPGGNQASTDTAAAFALPATWTHASYGSGRHSFYATVTAASGTNYNETGRAVDVVSTVTGSDDTGGMNETGRAVTVTSTVALVDQADLKDLARAVSIVASVTGADTFPYDVTYPASISGRKLLDQNGEVFLLPTMCSWALSTQQDDAGITTALETVAAAGFKGVTVWNGGGRSTAGFNEYTTVEHGDLWTGTPWASSLGPGWAAMDHVVAECARLNLVATLGLMGAFGTRGAGPEWEAVTNTNMYNSGVAVATRYLDSPNIVWHVVFDQPDTPATTRGQRVQAFYEGVNDAEGASTRPVRWMEADQGTTTYGRGWYQVGEFNCSINSIYTYDNDAVVKFEAGWAETSGPTGDCEPPYVGAPHYEGIATQQYRERNFAVFIEGGCFINFSHEDWWPFGPSGAFSAGLEWYEVFTDSVSVVESSHCWSFIDEHLRDVSYGPVSTFVTTGEGSGDTKAAQGASGSVAVAYFPDNRTVAVDTTILAGTGNVTLRWYDPTAGTYTTIAASEAQQTGRSVTLPAAHSDGARDWVLIAERIATDYDELALTVTVTATVTGTGQVDFEDAGSVTITATVTGLDVKGLDELVLGVAVVSTVTATDQADYEDLARAVSIVATVTGVGQVDYDELGLPVTIASTVTSADQADYEQPAMPVNVVATVTATDGTGGFNEQGRVVTITATVTGTARADFDQTAMPLAVTATVAAATDQGDFEDPARALSIVATVTGLDVLSGAPIVYNETGRVLSIAATVTAADLRDSVETLTIAALVSVSLSAAFSPLEALQIAGIAQIAIGDVGAFNESVAVAIDSTVIGVDTVPDFADPWPRTVSHSEPPALTYREQQPTLVHQE